MSDDEREQELAREFARVVDGAAVPSPALDPEWEAVAAIDRALEPARAALPERLSGHRILAEIASGGMGRVLLGFDEALNRQVAIKTLAPRFADDAILRSRFMGEARAMARVSHPHIARIYSLGPLEEMPHFVMERVEGRPLTEAAAKLSFEQKAELMRKIVLAAGFLHDEGILHRDLKPANILIGADLEPKLVDFGLALDLGERERLSKIGEIAGTPEYLSPEQTLGAPTLDRRSDIFSLGVVLYELLTGTVPFRGETPGELLGRIRTDDPVLPRRLDARVPQDLQNISLKALEKDPAKRYGSAREMADDLRRYLAGETVLAEPGAYARLITGKVAQHLEDLESWRREQIVSDAESDGIRRRYERLVEREDAWILEARRLALPQVALYLGAWVLAVAAAMLTFFPYPALAGLPAVALAWGAAAPVLAIGLREWRRGYFRVAIAYLIAFAIVTPVAVLVSLEEAHLAAAAVGQELYARLEFPKHATNAQIWWALAAGLPVSWALRRHTRAPVFSLLFATTAALFALATLLRMGMLDWLDHDPGRFYLHLAPWAALFMAVGLALERLRRPDDSRYFYPFAVAFAWAALSGLAAEHKPYAEWLGSVAPWTRGQVEYLFILNAGIYAALDWCCDRLGNPQARVVGKAFRFVIPGHVMTSLLLLSFSAKTAAEARTLEWLLPAVAAVFVFASIPRQMKNFFVSGMFFLAVGVFRVQNEIFPERAGWPVLLLVAGLGLMLSAANYAPLKVALGRVGKNLSR